MECIKAVEGSVKKILEHIHSIYTSERYDDSDHIKNIKAVIEGADSFLRSEGNFSSQADTLRENLFQFARQLWLDNARKEGGQDSSPETEDGGGEDEGYLEYYYDHIYHEGDYPL